MKYSTSLTTLTTLVYCLLPCSQPSINSNRKQTPNAIVFTYNLVVSCCCGNFIDNTATPSKNTRYIAQSVSNSSQYAFDIESVIMYKCDNALHGVMYSLMLFVNESKCLISQCVCFVALESPLNIMFVMISSMLSL